METEQNEQQLKENVSFEKQLSFLTMKTEFLKSIQTSVGLFEGEDKQMIICQSQGQQHQQLETQQPLAKLKLRPKHFVRLIVISACAALVFIQVSETYSSNLS